MLVTIICFLASHNAHVQRVEFNLTEQTSIELAEKWELSGPSDPKFKSMACSHVADVIAADAERF